MQFSAFVNYRNMGVALMMLMFAVVFCTAATHPEAVAQKCKPLHWKSDSVFCCDATEDHCYTMDPSDSDTHAPYWKLLPPIIQKHCVIFDNPELWDSATYHCRSVKSALFKELVRHQLQHYNGQGENSPFRYFHTIFRAGKEISFLRRGLESMFFESHIHDILEDK